MLLDLSPRPLGVEVTSMMPPDSSQSMSPLAGGLALHPDRTTLPDRKNVKDSQSDSTRDMRMRGDRITRTTYNRLVNILREVSLIGSLCPYKDNCGLPKLHKTLVDFTNKRNLSIPSEAISK